MKKILIFVSLLLFCHVAMSQDTMTLTPQGCTLADARGKLSKSEVRTMLDADLYDSYIHARRKIISSDILMGVSGVSFLSGSFWLVAIPCYYLQPQPAQGPDDRELVDMRWLVYGAFSAASYLVSLTTGLPAFSIHKKGKMMMQEVADMYNSRHSIGFNDVIVQPTLGINTSVYCISF